MLTNALLKPPTPDSRLNHDRPRSSPSVSKSAPRWKSPSYTPPREAPLGHRPRAAPPPRSSSRSTPRTSPRSSSGASFFNDLRPWLEEEFPAGLPILQGRQASYTLKQGELRDGLPRRPTLSPHGRDPTMFLYGILFFFWRGTQAHARRYRDGRRALASTATSNSLKSHERDFTCVSDQAAVDESSASFRGRRGAQVSAADTTLISFELNGAQLVSKPRRGQLPPNYRQVHPRRSFPGAHHLEREALLNTRPLRVAPQQREDQFGPPVAFSKNNLDDYSRTRRKSSSEARESIAVALTAAARDFSHRLQSGAPHADPLRTCPTTKSYLRVDR